LIPLVHRENDPSRCLDCLSAAAAEEEKIPDGMTNSSPHLSVEVVIGVKVSTPTHQLQMRARIDSIGPIHLGRTLDVGPTMMVCPIQNQRNHRFGWMKIPNLRRRFRSSGHWTPSRRHAMAVGSLS
jgi:hypothetical protein